MMGLFSYELPLKCGRLHGRRGVRHEILCTAIQEEGTCRQALTVVTLHNGPLHIIEPGLNRYAVGGGAAVGSA